MTIYPSITYPDGDILLRWDYSQPAMRSRACIIRDIVGYFVPYNAVDLTKPMDKVRILWQSSKNVFSFHPALTLK